MQKLTASWRGRRSGVLLGTILATSLLAVAACGGGTGDAASSGGSSGEALPVVTINIGHVVSATEPTQTALVGVAKAVSERTGGRLTLKIFPDGQLGQNQDMQEQTLAGAKQIAQIDPGYAATLGGIDELNILGGPFLYDSADDINAVLDSDLVKDWNGQLAKNAGMHVLTWKFYFGERHIISDKGYPEPADLKGVKIRIPPNPSWVATFKALPSTGTTLEWSEVYSGMQQGVIDAAEAPLSTLKGSSLYEVGNTITLTGHFKAITGWGTSVKFWDTLPAEYQKILTEEFAAGAKVMTDITVGQEDTLRSEFKTKLGVKLVEPDIAAYKKAVLPFYSAFPKWRPGLYEQVLEIITKAKS